MSRRASILLFLTAIGLLVLAQWVEATAEQQTMSEASPLAGTEWWVEDIEQAGVVDNVHTTIAFPGPGQVAGDGGCNRYKGSVEFDGAAVKFGPLASTMKMCPPALMDQERKFHQAMTRVVSWEVASDTGLLHLKDGEGMTLIRAWQVTRDNPSSEQ